jgi:adenosylcobyric acid synthase
MTMAKALMIQGTASSAGKSLTVTGLCRIFRQDGFSVAPFKSQNMALNSFITSEGLEMGRAQVAQAEAAGVEPSVLMNPILLKPTGDAASQVIVDGEVVATMGAADYYRRKTEFVPAVRRAYEKLAARHDIVVIEGAGSPAEINLRDNDIVNMGMAAIAGAPVLLVGDIDRGGVFASLYGTVALLEPEERARIKGVIINKFRGDVNILRPGLAQLEDLTGVPVVGVVPWMKVDIDDEDSMSSRLAVSHGAKPLDAAVIRLPRIANFTDFNALDRHPCFGVRYVESLRQLGQPDLVIVPGTKNTMADLAALRQNGLEAAIKKLARGGVPVIGICGGYQMLGDGLRDPDCVEGGGSMRGMELS